MGAPSPLSAVRREDAVAIALAAELFVLVLASARAPGLWDRLAERALPVGDAVWEWQLIQTRLPWITAATADQFIPQMLGLDALGAVSFDKGCYPGQEIIARTQHRGEVKRRLCFLHAADEAAAPAISLFAPTRETPVGTVLNAARAPGGGEDLLAVAWTDSDELALGSPMGPRAIVVAQALGDAKARA